MQLMMPSCPPQPLHRLPSIAIKKQDVTAALVLVLVPILVPIPAPTPTLAPALVPVPAHPATATTVALRVDGRNAGAGHDHRIVPDTLAGKF